MNESIIGDLGVSLPRIFTLQFYRNWHHRGKGSRRRFGRCWTAVPPPYQALAVAPPATASTAGRGSELVMLAPAQDRLVATPLWSANRGFQDRTSPSRMMNFCPKDPLMFAQT